MAERLAGRLLRQAEDLLLREHLRERAQDGLLLRGTQAPEPPNQARLVDRAKLVEDDMTVLSLEVAGHPGGIAAALDRHRRNNGGGDVTVHLVWRDNQAGSSLLDLGSHSGIQIDKVNIEAPDYHSHSRS